MSDTSSFVAYEVKEPINYVDRCNVLAKALNLKFWPIGYKGFNAYDVWLLMESVYRIPVSKSFLNKTEFKHYGDAVIRMINNTLFSFDSLYDPSRKSPITSTHPNDYSKEYRNYGNAHMEMMRIAKKRIESDEEISYEEYSTPDLERVFNYLVNTQHSSKNIKKNTDQVSDNDLKIRFLQHLKVLHKSEAVEEVAYYNDLAASSNKDIFSGLEKQVNEMCNVLLKRDDYDKAKHATKYCFAQVSEREALQGSTVEGNNYYGTNYSSE